MTWTYSPAQLQTTPLYQVRFLVGDVLPDDPQLEDEEIQFALTLRSSIWGAAATCLRNLSSRFSRLSDSVQKELKVLYSSKARAYAARAAEMEAASVARGGFAGYAGGISVQDKINREEDTDRVPPNFNRGMTDNLNNPLAPAGNEPATDIDTGNAADQTTI